MKSEWNRVQVGELCSRVCSGGTPKSTNSEYYGGDIPWLNTREVNFNRISKTEGFITQAGLDNSSAKWIKKNCVIVAMYGATAGRCAITKIPLTTNQACCNLEIDDTKADYRFVYYALKNEYVRLSSAANGGAQQNLNAQQVKEFDIPYPPLPIQRKIASILSSLDDKIETNNAICRNLEEQAMALYKSWFVDFEPFQKCVFEESEIGMIPRGWRVSKMSDFFPVITGKKNANVAGEKGQYPFFSCSQEILWTDDYSFEGKAILVAGNGDFNVKRYNGKFEAYQRTYVLIPDNPKLAGILYYAISKGLSDITIGARGSVINFITKGNIADYKIAIPNNLIDLPIITTISSLNETIDNLNTENQNLSQLRNALLPKLMSGEIDLSTII